MNFSPVSTGEFIEFPVNPQNLEYSAPNTVLGSNYRRWNEALVRLGLAVPTTYPAMSISGERMPGIHAVLHRKALYEAGQYALLGTVCVDNTAHGLAGRQEEVSVEDIITDIARVTVGGEQRHPDIPPQTFEPTLVVCRDIGTISLLEGSIPTSS